MKLRFFLPVLTSMTILLLSACSSDPVVQANVASSPTSPEETASISPTAGPSATLEQTAAMPPTETINEATSAPTIVLTPTEDTRLPPREWAGWPVVPALTGTARDIYQRGIANGNDPHSVSVIGDCQSEPEVFLGIYETDRNPISAEEAYLQQTVDYFSGSFSRPRYGVRDGLSAPSALSPMWSDPDSCDSNENPVQCELRQHKPMFVFINIGTNWQAGASAQKYEEYLRQIVDSVIESGAVPILTTKADNIEGDHSLNEATARVAYDYDVPLYNFWRAAGVLPQRGLDGERDSVYLTPAGWDVRNYYALHTLDSFLRGLDVLEKIDSTGGGD